MQQQRRSVLWLCVRLEGLQAFARRLPGFEGPVRAGSGSAMFAAALRLCWHTWVAPVSVHVQLTLFACLARGWRVSLWWLGRAAAAPVTACGGGDWPCRKLVGGAGQAGGARASRSFVCWAYAALCVGPKPVVCVWQRALVCLSWLRSCSVLCHACTAAAAACNRVLHRCIKDASPASQRACALQRVASA
jgi:hypothetical protein